MWLVLLLLLSATARPPAESDRRFPDDLTLETVDARLREGRLTVGDRVLADEVTSAPVASPRADRIAFSAGGTLFVARAPDWRPVAVEEVGHPDRAAFAPDGRLVYVSARSGVPALWSWDGERRVQLTNVGVERVPGRAPEGFVPVPHRAPPWFDGDQVRWEAPDGPHAVEVPR